MAIVMPIEIFVFESEHFFSESCARYYSKEGKMLRAMSDRTSRSRKGIEFDSAIFCELLNIQTCRDAEVFTQKYPKLRVAFHGQHGVQLNEYDTEEHYYEVMKDAIALFNDLRLLIDYHGQLLKTEGRPKKNPSAEIRSMIEEIYRKRFRVLNQNASWSSLDEMEEAYYQIYNKVDAVTERFMDQSLDFSVPYQDLLDEYFDEHPDLYQEHQAAVWQKIEEIVISRSFEDLSSYLLRITENASIVFDPQTSTIIYRCSDLLTAMYMWSNVAAFNEDKYLECAHPKCYTFFLVDKVHPQKLCEKHIAARRRKRQNQKRKGATDNSKVAKPSDFEE